MTPERKRALEVAARLAGGPMSYPARLLCLETIRDGIDSALWLGTEPSGDEAAATVKCDARQQQAAAAGRYDPMELGIFQTLVRRWCVRAFGQEVADNHRERNHRFLEEALELGQSLGCSQEDAHVLVDYVYGRPAGKAQQEVGGVMITLAALCGAHTELSMDREAKMELGRINRPEVLEKIRAKQAANQKDIPLSPLPGQVPQVAQKPDRRTEPRTYTDAVGTDGGKATVARRI